MKLCKDCKHCYVPWFERLIFSAINFEAKG